MSANPNWPRWIFASISKHFNDELTAAGLTLFIEGQHRDTKAIKDFAELRLDGPNMIEVSRNYWQLKIEVNHIVQSAMDDTNYHRIHQNVGVVAAAYTRTINVYKLGTGAQDDQSFLGCLHLLQERRDVLEINHFGQISESLKLVQATVEGHYQMHLEA